MAELDKVNDVNQLGSVSSAGNIEGSGEGLKLSQKIDFEKYSNLARVNPQDLENLVTDSDGNLLPEEGLVAANKIAGETNTDGVKKADKDDEDLKAVRDLKLYNLFVTGRRNHEFLHDAIRDEKGNLKSEVELKKMNEDIGVNFSESMEEFEKEKSNTEAHKKLTDAYEKNAAIDKEQEEVDEKLKEEMGDEAFDKMQEEIKAKKEEAGELENKNDADLGTEEGRNAFINEGLSLYNERVDREKRINLEADDYDAVAQKYYGTDEREKALEQQKKSLEETKAAKAAQEKAQIQGNAQSAQQPVDSNAAPKDTEKLKEYIKDDPSKNAVRGQIYANANISSVISQIQAQDKQNDAININNNMFFDKKDAENSQDLFNEQVNLVFENGKDNEKDLLNIFANPEDGKKLTAEDIKARINASREEKTNSPLVAGLSDEKPKFSPYNASNEEEDAGDVFGADTNSENAALSSQLQFDKSSASEIDNAISDVGNQIDTEEAAFDARIQQETERAEGIDKDLATKGKMQELSILKKEGETAAFKDSLGYLGLGNSFASASGASISAGPSASTISNQAANSTISAIDSNITAQASHTQINANNETQKLGEGAAALAMAAMPGGQGWIAVAMQAFKMALEYGAEKSKSAGAENTLAQQQAQAKALADQQAAQQKAAYEAALNQYNTQTVPGTEALLAQFGQHTQQLTNAAKTQDAQSNALQTKRDYRMAKLEADKELLLKKKDEAANKETKTTESKEVKSEKVPATENKEVKENMVADAGNKAEKNKEVKADKKEVFELKENEDVKSEDMKAQFANQLMDDGKDTEKVNGKEALLANSAAPKFNAVNESEETEEDEDGASTVKFQAYSKENRITKEVLGVEDDTIVKVDGSEKQAKKPALRMASRFAKTVDKVNGIDGKSGKGFTA